MDTDKNSRHEFHESKRIQINGLESVVIRAIGVPASLLICVYLCPSVVNSFLANSASFMRRLRQTELMDHLHSDLAQGPHLRIHQHIGLPVKWSPQGKQASDLRHRIGLVEQRPVRLTFYAFEDFFRRSPKAYYQGMGLEAGQIAFYCG